MLSKPESPAPTEESGAPPIHSLAGGAPSQLRDFESAEARRLTLAFVISIFLHLLVFGTYETGRKLDWWQDWRAPRWLQTPKLLASLLPKPPPAPPTKPTDELPLMFVDVSPAVSTADAPETAKYYSDRNSKAANPENTPETTVPKVSGTQDQIPRADDVPREKFLPPQPTPPPATIPTAKEEQEEAKPAPPVQAKPPEPQPEPPKLERQPEPPKPEPTKPEVRKPEPPKPEPPKPDPPKPEPVREVPPPKPEPKSEPVVPADLALGNTEPQRPPEPAKPAPKPVGDLAMANPQPRVEPSQPKQPRPRTVREAQARNNPNRLPGERMKQEGGVSRRGQAALDVKATNYGDYDRAMVDAIASRWYSLLDERDYASDSRGRVAIRFVLHYDGRVTGLTVADSTVPEILSLLCQKSVLESAPFRAWTPEMRFTLGDTRQIQFTFLYN